LGLFGDLNIKVLESEVQSVGINPVELLPCQGSVEVRVFVRDDEAILGHEAEGQAAAELQEKGGKGIQRVFHVSGQNQVPHEHSPFCQGQVMFKKIKEALPGDHFFDRGKGRVRVVLAARESLREVAIRILEIRQVDVCVGMGDLDQFPGLIPGKVEDHGQSVSSLPECGDESESMGEEVIRGHEVDVVNPDPHDHGFDLFQEFTHVQALSEAVPGNLMVLAKGATEGASCEENGSRAPSAGQGRLFTEVGADVSDPQLRALLAEALPAAGGAVHAAGPRAKAACFVHVHGIHGMIMQ